MKITKILLIVLLPALIISCKKEKQYSTWSINDRRYSSNNIESSVNHDGELGFGSVLGESGFHMLFHVSEYPTTDLAISNSSHYTNTVQIGINDTITMATYVAAEDGVYTLKARVVNGKAQYILEPSWFVKYYDHTDSVLVQGIFNQP